MEQLIGRVVKAREASLYSGAIDNDDFTAIKEDCEKINVLGLQLQQLANLQIFKSDNLEQVSRILMDTAAFYEHSNLDTKRQNISLAFNWREIYKDPMEQMLCLGFKAIFNLQYKII